MPLILHILNLLIATICVFLAAIKRPEGALSWGWFGFFWFLLDLLVTAIVTYGH